MQRSIGYPSRTELMNAIQMGIFVNCPITVQDIEKTECYYGKSVPELKSKSRNADHKIITIAKTQSMCCDIVFINNILYLLSVCKLMILLFYSTTNNSIKARTLGELLMSHVNILKS